MVMIMLVSMAVGMTMGMVVSRVSVKRPVVKCKNAHLNKDSATEN